MFWSNAPLILINCPAADIHHQAEFDVTSLPDWTTCDRANPEVFEVCELNQIDWNRVQASLFQASVRTMFCAVLSLSSTLQEAIILLTNTKTLQQKEDEEDKLPDQKRYQSECYIAMGTSSRNCEDQMIFFHVLRFQHCDCSIGLAIWHPGDLCQALEFRYGQSRIQLGQYEHTNVIKYITCCLTKWIYMICSGTDQFQIGIAFGIFRPAYCLTLQVKQRSSQLLFSLDPRG